MVLIAIFALVGIGIIASGYRGRSVACDPVCAKCGYDLRGYAVLTRCSECGSDLNSTDAVRKNKLTANRRRVVTGICIIAVPWVLVALSTLRSLAGPNWERLRSNKSLISEIDSIHYGGAPSLWNELARRLTNGTLTKSEASAAVDQIIASIQHQPVDSLQWSDPFFKAAQTSVAISGPQYLAMAKAFYGNKVHVDDIPASIAADERGFFPIYASWLTGRELPAMDHDALVKQITIMRNIDTPPNLGASDAGTAGSPPVNLLTPDGSRMAAPSVLPGNYTLKIVIQCRLLSSAAPASSPLAAWTETLTQPLQVTPPRFPESYHPNVIVRTDTAADPTTLPSPAVAPAR